MDTLSHSVTTEVRIPAAIAFEFMQDPLKLGTWALGCWDTGKVEGKDLYCGTSLIDGEKTFSRISAYRELGLVDFYVGDANSLKPRVSARVIAGDSYGGPDDHCLVTLMAWRAVGMDENRWHQLCMCHETEILMIKAKLESL